MAQKKFGSATVGESVNFRRQLTPDDFYAPLQSNSPLASGEIIMLIDEVLQYPDLYPGSSLLQQGLYTVFVLGIEDRNRVALGTAGACQSVLKVMDLFIKNKKIQLFGCAAISNLAYINSENQDLLVNHGAIEAVVKAMKSYPRTQELQVHGCTAIRNLAQDHPYNASKLVNAGARLVINISLVHFGHDASVAHWAHEALLLLPEKQAPLLPTLVAELAAHIHEEHRHEHEEEEAMARAELDSTSLTNDDKDTIAARASTADDEGGGGGESAMNNNSGQDQLERNPEVDEARSILVKKEYEET